MSTVTITLKSLKGDTFPLQVELDSTVAQLKEKVKAEKSLSVDKLIHQGKILEDANTLASYNIKNDHLIIVMLKKEEPRAAAPAPAPAPAPAAAQPAPQPAAQPAAQPATQPAAQPAAAAAPAALSPELEAAVTEMCSMGFPREQVLLAMRAAFNDVERATQYLLDGIPDDVFGGGDGGDDDQGDDGDMGAGELTPDQLRQAIPGLDQALAAVRQRPEMLQQLLAQLAQSRPEVVQLINQNRGAFLQMLAGEEGGAGGDGGADLPAGYGQPVQLQVTAEEHAAIQRLMDLGFPQGAVIEAYLTCDKNEELAANYLFENFGN